MKQACEVITAISQPAPKVQRRFNRALSEDERIDAPAGLQNTAARYPLQQLPCQSSAVNSITANVQTTSPTSTYSDMFNSCTIGSVNITFNQRYSKAESKAFFLVISYLFHRHCLTLEPTIPTWRYFHSPHTDTWDVERTLEKLVNHSPNGSWFTSFSRVLPTSRVVYCVGKPIERVVYCLNSQLFGLQKHN